MSWEWNKETEENTEWVFSHYEEEGTAELLEIDLDDDGRVVKWIQIHLNRNWLWN